MSSTPRNGTILDAILARTAANLETQRLTVPSPALEREIQGVRSTMSLRQALWKPGLAVIAEIKRASPSKGRFPVEIDVGRLAIEYQGAGADAVSVLTNEPFFEGSLDDLRVVANILREAQTPIPVMRKDFVIDEYQLLEARAAGADATLLIVAALTQRRLKSLMTSAASVGLDALVEVHDEAEMSRALDAGATLIGINNRDLRTFEVDLSVSERLAPFASGEATLVAESGISTADDVKRMTDAGIDAILVGESLILAENRRCAIHAFKSDSIPL
jgi:indole-3-glycerol phosphate synthase